MDRNLSKLRETVKDRGARQAAAHGVTEGWTQLSNWTKTTKHFCLPASTKLLGWRWEWIMKCTAKPHRSTKTSTFNNNITAQEARQASLLQGKRGLTAPGRSGCKSVWDLTCALLRGLPCPTPQDLPNPGIECTSPSLTGRFFTTAPPGKLTLCSFNLNFLLFHLKMLCFLKITYFNKRGSPQMKIILLNCIGIVLHLMSWILRLMLLPFTKEKDLSRKELNIWGHQIEHFLWW